jgi:putative serine protease PepD
VTTALVASLVGALIGAGAVVTFDDNAPSARISAASTRDPDATITQTGGSSDAALSRPAGSVAAIAAKVLPSVVTIEETSDAGQGTGSGVVLRSDGYILTNNHVVSDIAGGGAGTKLVIIPNGKTEADAINATIVGTDPLTDLAVIKADGGTSSSVTTSSRSGPRSA